MKRKKLAVLTALVLSGTMSAASARDDACASLPTQSELRAALIAAVAEEASGLDFQMWATIVDRDGVVCAVAFSGANRGAMARQPRDFGAESECGERFQPRRPRAFDGQFVLGNATGRQPVRAAAQQPGCHEGRL